MLLVLHLKPSMGRKIVMPRIRIMTRVVGEVTGGRSCLVGMMHFLQPTRITVKHFEPTNEAPQWRTQQWRRPWQ